MEATISAYRHEFTRKAQISREQQARLDFEFYNKARKAEEADRAEREKTEEFYQHVEMILATKEDVADFEVKLDAYDTATVEALMQNEQDLTAARERIDAMLLEAHTLPDGRRVFKTRDGARVFDEHGQEVKPDAIAPERISGDRPSWESFLAARDDQARLQQERGDLLEYQGKLDQAREPLDDPKLSKTKLDALERELGQSMPDRVRANLGGDAPAKDVRHEAEPVPSSTRPADMPRRDPSLAL